MEQIPTNSYFIVAGMLAVASGGAVFVRVMLVERLRIIAGGTEPRWLRRGKRVIDLLALIMLSAALVWLALGLAKLWS